MSGQRRSKPAGTPADWEDRPAAGSPDDPPSEAEVAVEVERDLDRMLEDTKRERDEYLQLAQRARADFENYRKRASREATEAERRGKAAIARELIPALDNLERALRAVGIDPETGKRVRGEASEQGDSDPAAAPGAEGEEGEDNDVLAKGVALVYRELLATLERAGVERYDPDGEPFDPAWHEALATRAEDGAEPGVVVETLEKGYRLDGQVIRAARVVVSE
jgi:molecular chaperone GrpE